MKAPPTTDNARALADAIDREVALQSPRMGHSWIAAGAVDAARMLREVAAHRDDLSRNTEAMAELVARYGRERDEARRAVEIAIHFIRLVERGVTGRQIRSVPILRGGGGPEMAMTTLDAMARETLAAMQAALPAQATPEAPR